MFGQNQFGEKLFAASSVKSEYLPSEDFTFNTYGLQNQTRFGIHISDYEIETPKRDFRTKDVPGNHGMILQEDWFRENPIKINGWVSAASRNELDSKIHEMMKNLQGQGGTLYMKNEGTFKELITTLQKANFENKHYSTTRKRFSLEFEGVKSFWRDKDFSSVFYANQTSLSINGQMNNGGSVQAEPIIIMIFSAADAITAVEFQNTTTGETVSVTENISDGDVLIIDSETKTVKLNNVELEFSGRLPALQVGINSFTISMTGTSATCDVTAKHKNQYLTP